jgi:hypothetical protein
MSGEYLRECATHGHTDELRRILKEKCNPCSVDKFGLTALHYAVWNGHVECVKYLVCNNWGVDKNGIKRHALNMVSVRGFSALHLAAQDAPQWVAQEITELLLISGVDPTTVDKDGKLAIDYARRENNVEVLAAFDTYDQLMDALRQREEEANRLEGTVLDDTIQEEGDSEEVKQMLEAVTPVGPTPVSILPVETYFDNIRANYTFDITVRQIRDVGFEAHNLQFPAPSFVMRRERFANLPAGQRIQEKHIKAMIEYGGQLPNIVAYKYVCRFVRDSSSASSFVLFLLSGACNSH